MRYLLLFSLLLIAHLGHPFNLKPNAPSRYVVKHGDNLWAIANKYLEHPWEWKQLMHANPHVKNPSRLYPGTVLVLNYYQNTPYLKVLPNGTIKLSPTPRLLPVDDPVPSIPLGDIKPFLTESLILDQNILARAPYVVAYTGERMLGGQGDEVYVKGLHPSKEMPKGERIAYSVFRAGKNYFDPMTQQLLGYKATLVGYAELMAGGEPATVLLTHIKEGIQVEDKVLINNSPEFNLYFEPATPTSKIFGYIIDMPGGMPGGNSQEAVGEIVVISLGATSGLKPGDVLGIYSKNRTVPDPRNSFTPIQLPPERVGEAMVFRTFTKTSFALIVRSVSAIYLLDTVTNP